MRNPLHQSCCLVLVQVVPEYDYCGWYHNDNKKTIRYLVFITNTHNSIDLELPKLDQVVGDGEDDNEDDQEIPIPWFLKQNLKTRSMASRSKCSPLC